MRSYSQIIDRLLERFLNQEISFDDPVACYLFANLRQLLEQNNVQNIYPALNLYTNWILHPELNRNKVSNEVLSTIIESLPQESIVSPTFIDIVNQNLRLENLQQEIIDLSERYVFRNIFLDASQWRQMCGVILNLITEKPLAPPLKLKAESNLRISPNNSAIIKEDSTIRLWLHGQRGQQAEWTIAIVPERRTFDMANLDGLQILSGGVFTR